MDDLAHVRPRPPVAAIDERLEGRELLGGLAHAGIVSLYAPLGSPLGSSDTK